jgi:hypothetical protein
VITLDGETLVFAMMANNFRVPTAEIDAVMELALNRLVAVRNEEPTKNSQRIGETKNGTKAHATAKRSVQTQ